MPTKSMGSHRMGRSLNFLIGLIVVGLGLLSCAAPQSKLETNFMDKQTRRILDLQEKIRTQENEIALLREQLTEFRAEKDVRASLEEALEGQVSVKKPAVVQAQGGLPQTPQPPMITLKGTQPYVGQNGLPVVEAVPSEAEKKETVATSLHEAMHFYFSGLDLMKQSKFDRAIRSFRTFLEMSPQHVYADRANYWISEAFFRNKEYTLSLAKSNNFESKYPYSIKVPDVLFKRGLSLAELGEVNKAKSTLRALVQQYPEREVAQEAEKILARLN